MGRASQWIAIGVLTLVCQPGCAIPSRAGARTYTPKPIPSAADAYTQADWMKAYAQCELRMLDLAYQQHGKHDAAWDQEARRYIEDWRRAWTGEPAPPTYAEFIRRGRALVTAGCDDPLVLYLAGTGLQVTGSWSEAESLLRRAVEGLRSVPYPRAEAAWAAARLSVALENQGGDREEEAWDFARQMADWVVESSRDGSYQEGEHRLMLSSIGEMSSMFPLEVREMLYEALKESPTVHPYVKNAVGGDLYVDKAWEARGSGWADTVTEQGWRDFQSTSRSPGIF